MKIKNSNVWTVRFTLPAIPNSADRRRTYVTNRNVVCFCETVDEALALVRTEHPDATVYGVNHRGKDEVYFDGVGLSLPRGLAVPSESKAET